MDAEVGLRMRARPGRERFLVLGLRFLEVAREASDRLAEPAHPTEEEAAVAAVIRVGRLDDGEEVDDAEGGRPVAPGEVDRPEVAQDPGEDRAAPRSPEQAHVEQDTLAERAADERLAIVGGQRPAAAGRVDQQPVRTAHDEVTR